MLRQDQPLHPPAAKSNCEQQSQFSAALEHIAQHHYPQTGAAQQQTQTTENLKGAEIRVLHSIELIQSLRGGREFRTNVLQRARERGRNLSDCVGRRIKEKKPIAALARKTFYKLRFANDEAPLENRVR